MAHVDTELDDIGENNLTQIERKLAARVEELADLIFSRMRHGGRAYVVTDHGFVLLPEGTAFEALPPPDGDVKRRRVRGACVECLLQIPAGSAMDNSNVEISSRDYWFKVVEFLQQNWALIESKVASGDGVTVYFITDTSGVFDRMEFDSEEQAMSGLLHNGFERYAEDETAQKYISPPEPPFREAAHPNGKIYSSGRFWDEPSKSDFR